MKPKFFVRLILSVVLSVSLFSTGISAATGTQTINCVVTRPAVTFTAESLSASLSAPGAALPPLKDGTAVRWIDRLDELPEYATDFYTWLETNAAATGALSDVTKGERLTEGEYAGSYVHEITGPSLLNGYSGEFTFPTGTSDAEIQNRAWADFEKNHWASLSAAYDESVLYHVAAFSAFDRDHPEVFWLSGSSSIVLEYWLSLSYWGTTAEYHVTPHIYFLLQSSDFDIRAEGYRNADDIAAAIAGRDSALNTILAGVSPSDSRYDQIKYINSWLTSHNQYNTSSNLNNIPHETRECVSALAGTVGANGPVCEGYARAFKVICDRLNIPCVLTDGNAKTSPSSSGEPHMWNYVQMEDGNWYGVDITWNDPTGGPSGAVSGYENDGWLLLGSDTEMMGMKFIESHPVSNTVSEGGVAFINGPVLSADRYSPPQGGAGSEPEEEPLNSDVSGDGATDLADLSLILWHFNSTDAPNCDLVKNGVVDVADLTAMLSAIRAANPDLLPYGIA